MIKSFLKSRGDSSPTKNIYGTQQIYTQQQLAALLDQLFHELAMKFYLFIEIVYFRLK